MAEKRDTSLTISGQQLEMTAMSKSIIEPQKVAPVDIEMPEDYLEKMNMSSRQEGFNPIQTWVCIDHNIALQPPHHLVFQIVCLLVALYFWH